MAVQRYLKTALLLLMGMAAQCPLFAQQGQLYPNQSGLPAYDVRAVGPQNHYETNFLAEEEDGEEENPYAEINDTLEDFEERFDEIEDANKALADEIEEAVVRGTSNASVKFSGRIHGDYWAFPRADYGAGAFENPNNPLITPEDRILWRRVRFGAKGNIKDNMVYKIEMEFANPNDTEYRDIYIGFTNLPILQTLLIGNQKRPLGLDHINSSRYNVFVERPFIVEAFNEDARRLGIVSYGYTKDLRWNWRYGIYNLEKTQDDAGYIGDEYQSQVAARLANTAWWDEYSGGRGYAHWAISGSVADPDGSDTPGDGNANEARFRTRPEARTSMRWLDTTRIPGGEFFEQLNFEGVVNVGPLQIVAEVMNTWVDREPPGAPAGAPSLYFWGGYVYAAYFLTGEHMPWDRETGQLARPKPFENFFLVNTCDCYTDGGLGAWQVALRYSYADLSDDNILGGVGESLTLGLNWYWNPNARLQMNYIHGHIHDHFPVAGATNAHYGIFGARFMIDF